MFQMGLVFDENNELRHRHILAHSYIHIHMLLIKFVTQTHTQQLWSVGN